MSESSALCSPNYRRSNMCGLACEGLPSAPCDFSRVEISDFLCKLEPAKPPMNASTRFLPFIILLWMAWGFPGSAQGVATVWDGPLISFNHPADVGTGVRDDLTPMSG